MCSSEISVDFNDFESSLSVKSLYGQGRSLIIESDIINVSGSIEKSAEVNISGEGSPEYRICNDNKCLDIVLDWQSQNASISNEQFVQFRLKSSHVAGVNSRVQIRIGELVRDWNVKTALGPELSSIYFGSLKASENKLLAINMPLGSTNPRLYQVDLITGERVIISSPLMGIGTDFDKPSGVYVSILENKAYIIDNGASPALFEVGTMTGNRSILSNSSNGTGTNFSNPVSLCLNPSEEKAYVLDNQEDAIFEVDLATGNRTIISDAITGTGPNFTYPISMVVSNKTSKAFVTDTSLDAVLEMDLATGNRTIISSSKVGMGRRMNSLKSIRLSALEEKAYVLDMSYDTLFEIDLLSGDRDVAFDSNVGLGVTSV